MSLLRARTAVSPLRRRFADIDAALPEVSALVAVEQPEEPMHCLRPATIAATAREFVDGFAGDVLYAVKCNPEPAVLRALWAGGVRHFDCASAGEVALVRTMFAEAHIAFMHPVKARGAIREAFFRHGVSDFVLDSAAELAKILRRDRRAGRPRVGGAAGAAERQRRARSFGKVRRGARRSRAPVARCPAARSPARAVVPCRLAEPGPAGVARGDRARGFGDPRGRRARGSAGRRRRLPGRVSGHRPAAARRVLRRDRGGVRGIVAAGHSALGRAGARAGGRRRLRRRAGAGAARRCAVRQRRRLRQPLRCRRARLPLSGAPAPAGGGTPSAVLRGFTFFGPTCDSADAMRGPFLLPEDVREGDWIELGQLGAYGGCLRTGFNGFDRARIVEVRDAPMPAAAISERLAA